MRRISVQVILLIIATLARAELPPQAFGDMRIANLSIVNAYLGTAPTALWIPSKYNSTDVVRGIVASNMGTASVSSEYGWVFGGSGGYLDVGKVPSLEIGTNSYTMTGWVWTVDKQGALGGKFWFGAGDRWYMYFNGDAAIDDNWSYINITSAGTVVSNWMHMAVTFDRAGSISTYINGIRRASASITGLGGRSITYDGNKSLPFRIGVMNDASGNPIYPMRGYLNYIAVWNGRALASNEVYNLYRVGR